MADKSKRHSNRIPKPVSKNLANNLFQTVSWDDFDVTDSDEEVHSAKCLNKKDKIQEVKNSTVDLAFKKPLAKGNKGKSIKCNTRGKSSPLAGISSSQSRIDELIRNQAHAKHTKGTRKLFRSATFSDLSVLSGDADLREQAATIALSQDNRRVKIVKSDSCESFVSAVSAQESTQHLLTDTVNYTELSNSQPAVSTSFDLLVKDATLETPQIEEVTQQLKFKDIPKEGEQCQLSDSENEVFIKQTTPPMERTDASINTGQSIKPDSTLQPSGTAVMDSLEQQLLAFQTSINETVAHTISESLNAFKADIKKDISDIRSDYATNRAEITTEIDTKVKGVSDLLTSMKAQINGVVVQNREIQDVVIRQSQELKECKSEILKLKQRSMNTNIIIRGLVKGKEETWLTTVKAFFKNVMEIGELELLDAFKLGKSPYSPVLVTTQDVNDKMLILKNAKKLKDKVNKYDKPYRVDEQLPPELREKKIRARHLMTTNYHKEGNEQLRMERKNGELYVEGLPYVKAVQPPSVREILKASKETRLKRAKTNVAEGSPIDLNNSRFIGYSAIVKDLEEVNAAYARIKADHIGARHVICAFRIPNTAYHTHQDYFEDDEHGAGRTLLKALVTSNIMHRAIFVVRYYDGTHVGPDRFRSILDAAKDAVIKQTHNHLTGKHEMLWTSDNVDQNPQRAIRGKGGLFGRRPSGPKRTNLVCDGAADTDFPVPTYSQVAMGQTAAS